MSSIAMPVEIDQAVQDRLQGIIHDNLGDTDGGKADERRTVKSLFAKGLGAATNIDAAWDRGIKLLAGAVLIFMVGYISRSTPWRLITIVASAALGIKGVCFDICGGFGKYSVDVYGLQRRTLISQVNQADNRIVALWNAMDNGLHGRSTAFGKNGEYYPTLIEWAGIELRGDTPENRYTALALIILGIEHNEDYPCLTTNDLNAVLAKAQSAEEVQQLVNLGARFEERYQASVLSRVPEDKRCEFISWMGKKVDALSADAQALIPEEVDEMPMDEEVE